MNLFDLIARLRGAYDALKAGNWSAVADFVSDMLKAAAPLLPKGHAAEVLPLSFPGGFDLDKLISLIQLLKSIFGK